MFGLHVVEQSSNEDFLPNMRQISYEGTSLQRTYCKTAAMWNFNPDPKPSSFKLHMSPL